MHRPAASTPPRPGVEQIEHSEQFRSIFINSIQVIEEEQRVEEKRVKKRSEQIREKLQYLRVDVSDGIEVFDRIFKLFIN